ncbi:MAG: hypothetical protein IJT30_02585 [Muribaculaceae bacterium]|nr:hypothetical protein [Muribaculaceae bacterium]
MVNRLFLGLVTLLLACAPVHGQTLLAELDGQHVEGWIYVNNGGIELTGANLTRGKIVLQTTVQGNVTALQSPWLTCADYDSLRVVMLYEPFELQYDATRLAVTADLLDAAGTVLTQMVIPADTEKMNNGDKIAATTALPHGTAGGVLQLTAPRADKDNCAAVKLVRIYGITAVNGDVNGDGVVDIDDVNILINIVLHKDDAANYGSRAFLTGGSVVDVADINAIINILLHKQ